MATKANVKVVEDKVNALDTKKKVVADKVDARGVKVTSRFDKIMYHLGIQ